MSRTSMKNIAIAGLLGAALLLGTPPQGHAEPGKGRGHGNGKGWRSERGENEERVKREVRGKGKAFRSVERNAGRSSAKWSAPKRSNERGTVERRSASRRNEERVARRAERPSASWRGESNVVRRTRERTAPRESRVFDGGDRVVQSTDRVRTEPTDRVRRDYSYRAPSRTRVQTTYRAPRWSGGRYYTGARYYSAYRGYPVYREYVSYRYAPAYGPAYGWRYYCAPRYDYGTHVIYVQPVRFFVAADFVIGGVGISARYVDPGPVYGCNFCDARFGSFYDYEMHVEHHSVHAPHGYHVIADDWHEHVWEQGEDDYYEDDGY